MNNTFQMLIRLIDLRSNDPDQIEKEQKFISAKIKTNDQSDIPYFEIKEAGVSVMLTPVQVLAAYLRKMVTNFEDLEEG